MFELQLRQKHRTILHIDADAFFASVEQVLNPTLKGKPILVGGPSSKNGIVSAASYEAKKFGIYSGMPIYLAKKTCPKAVIVPGNFKAYRNFSQRMYQIFLQYTPDVQMVSIDEAYLDISGCEELHKKPAKEIARSILFQIYKELGITVSCGMASNKSVAKIASSRNKPHKLTVIPYGKEASFMKDLSLRDMPGVGPKTYTALERFGLKKIGDVAELRLSDVVERFGIPFVRLWKKCRGCDNSPVSSESRLPKSISKEHTLYKSVSDKEVCLAVLRDLVSDVGRRLRRHKMKAKTIFIKIRYKEYVDGQYVFRNFGYQHPANHLTSSNGEIFKVVKQLFEANYQAGGNVRLLGAGVSNLIKNYNLDLFVDNAKQDQLFTALDQLKNAYGDEVLSYGA